MKHPVDISVVMSVYNGSAFLEEAIRSILSQSFSNFEFIIVDDGSVDRSPAIIRSFTDNRIVCIYNEHNMGLVKSLNKGLEAARGRFIARMDADDVALPNRLEQQFNFLVSHPEVVALGSDYYLLSGGRQSYISNEGDGDFLKTLLLFAPCFCHPTVMMKNLFADSRLQYDPAYRHTEDYKLWTDLAFEGQFANLGQPLLKYRSHSKQVSTENRDHQLLSSSGIRKNYLDRLGFRVTETQLQVHNLVGDGVFIRSGGTLGEIENWLMDLLEQNTRLKSIGESGFNAAIHKFWYDSCGNSNLGLEAFRRYKTSAICKHRDISTSQKLALLGKCILRKFKS